MFNFFIILIGHGFTFEFVLSSFSLCPFFMKTNVLFIKNFYNLFFSLTTFYLSPFTCIPAQMLNLVFSKGRVGSVGGRGVVVVGGRRGRRDGWLEVLAGCDGVHPMDGWWFERAQRHGTHWMVCRRSSLVDCCRAQDEFSHSVFFLYHFREHAQVEVSSVFDEVGVFEEVRNFIIICKYRGRDVTS